jgi:hypothetical protein
MILYDLKGCIDPEFCDTLAHMSKGMSGWTLDGLYDGSDSTTNGFLIKSFPKQPIQFKEEVVLRSIAEFLTISILKKTTLDYECFEMQRILVNYYNKSMSCPKHKDSAVPSDISIILFLTEHGNDYTEIGGKKYYPDKGDVLIFKSNTEHSGTGSVDNEIRMNMNVLISRTKYED